MQLLSVLRRPDDSKYLGSMVSKRVRGFYSAHYQTVRRSGRGDIAEFIDRSAPGVALRAVGEPAKLAIDEESGANFADMSYGDGYIHDYKYMYGRSWTLGIVFIPVESKDDQIIVSAGDISITIPSGMKSLIVECNQSASFEADISYGDVTSILCGYSGSRLRGWNINGDMVDVECAPRLGTAANLLLGVDSNGGRKWKGHLGELAIFPHYEPAHNINLHRIWNDYVSFVYGVK